MKRNKQSSPKRRANKITPSPTEKGESEVKATRREQCMVCGRTIQPGTTMVGKPHAWRHRNTKTCKAGRLIGVHGIAYQRKGASEFFDQMDRSKRKQPVTVRYVCICPRNCPVHPISGT